MNCAHQQRALHSRADSLKVAVRAEFKRLKAASNSSKTVAHIAVDAWVGLSIAEKNFHIADLFCALMPSVSRQ
jgi:hypothetical protein